MSLGAETLSGTCRIEFSIDLDGSQSRIMESEATYEGKPETINKKDIKDIDTPQHI